MKKARSEPTKVVALYPFTRGLGYAVMSSPLDLVEFNLFDLKFFDSRKVMDIVKEIFKSHGNLTLVMEDTNSKYCRKGQRTKSMIKRISSWAIKNDIPIYYCSRDEVRTLFSQWRAQNKFEIAEVLKRNIPLLKNVVFEKPRYPGREPNNEAIFSAISMIVTYYFVNE